MAVLDHRISPAQLGHALDSRGGGLAALEALHGVVEMGLTNAPHLTPMMALVDAYAALHVHDARERGALLHPTTVSQYVGYMRAAARAMPTLGDWTASGIKSFLDSLTVARPRVGVGSVSVAPATHRRYLWALLVLGDFLVSKQYLHVNPAESVAPRSLRGSTRRKQVWLQHAEWVAILGRLQQGVIRDALEFMLATGAEPGSTCALTGYKVCHTGASAVLDTNGKGGAARRRTVAVDAVFQSKLARLAKVAGAGLIFNGCRAVQLTKALARVRADLAAEGFAKHTLVYPYQLRHTWACASLEAGALLHDVAAQLGHAKVSTTLDHYGPGRANATRVAAVRTVVTATISESTRDDTVSSHLDSRAMTDDLNTGCSDPPSPANLLVHHPDDVRLFA